MENKEEIVKKLKEYSVNLNKSPGRRDVHWKFYLDCVNEFGSFNEAKKAAGLKVFKRTADILSEGAKKKTLELVRVVSYITGDGHLHKDLKGFLHSSKDINSLKDFEQCIRKQFRVEVSKIQEGGYGRGVFQYRYFNTAIAKFLHEIGTAKGDKVITPFEVPMWIRENKEFMREYLKILYYCEGCKYVRRDSGKVRIQINMRKTNDLLDEGQLFMEGLKESLKKEFKIESGKLRLSKGKSRSKDNKRTKDIRFEIKGRSINRFIEEIGWLK